MNIDQTIQERAERYIRGEMNADEQNLFEHKVRTDVEFAKVVNNYLEFFSAFNHFASHSKLRNELDTYHAKLPKKGKVIAMPAVAKSDSANIRRMTVRVISIAATITIVSFIGAGIFFNYLSSTKKSSTYTQLMKEVDQKIKNSQKQIINQMGPNPMVSKKPATEGKYSATGFLVTGSGYLLTSYHLVKEANAIQVVNAGFAYNAELITYNANCDYALLRINDESFERLKNVPYSFYKNNAEMGQHVFTLGYPRTDLVYGEGSVSSLTGFADDTIAYQVSVPANPGNSGGPLFDENGNIIGMLSGKQSRTEAASFAIKSNYLFESLSNVDDEAFNKQFNLYNKKTVANKSRVQQIKNLKPYIFEVRVIN